MLKDLLKFLHPFMPFITEEIWSALPAEKEELTEENPEGFLIGQKWPVYSEKLSFPEEEAAIETAMEAVRTIRNIRAEAGTVPSKKVKAVILAEGVKSAQFRKVERHIMTQAGVTDISYINNREELTADVMSGVMTGAEIFINTEELVEYAAEKERLLKEKEKLESEVARVEKKLSNSGFVSKAPEKVVMAEREKQVKYQEMLAKVVERLAVVEEKIK